MKIRLLVAAGAVLLATSALGQSKIEAGAKDEAFSAGPVTCEELAADPANGLAGNPDVKSATSRIIAAAGPNVAHCQG